MTNDLNLLILQDSALATEPILSLLSEAGLTVTWQRVSTKAEYLAHLNPTINLLLIDYPLSEFDGIEAISYLPEQNLNIPVIIISHSKLVSIAVDYMKAGATGYLLHEQVAQLPQVIKQALAAKASEPKIKAQNTVNSTDLKQQLQAQTAQVAKLSEKSQQDNLEKEQIKAALAKSETQFQVLISKNPDGIVVIDSGGIVRFINPAALSLFSRQEDELLGQVLGFPVVGEDNTEVDVRTGTGANRVAQMRVVEIEWQGKKGYLVSLRDITEQKQVEEERIQLLEKAEAANRIKDEFLAIVSHELRTPLNPILGWSKLLRTRKLNQDKVDQALETIERNASLQAQLIDDLLDVSRILRGKLNLQTLRVDLVRVIQAAIETMRLAAAAKSIEIDTQLDSTVGFVSGDPNRLQQVVWNLLSNAVKFTPKGGRITVRLQEIDSQAQIQVSDTGQGISPDFFPYIFDYFRQENSTTTRSVGGLGLGLAIVRHLIELHGGRIEAESEGIGQGATFTVTLPLMPDSPINTQKSSPNDEGLDLSEVTVLLVEDEVDTLDLLTIILESYGARVEGVTSAHEALAVFSQGQPDVLISDIGMPGMDGYEFIRQVRELPPNRGGLVPAIALTAYAGETDHERALSAGFNRHLSKPIEPDQIVDAIANLVG
ncbi:ATPase, histidine kinase-, DNA gyrase B-, and HSP90-like domain protein [Coleofasciculus chthonoplastes PCC 7420]|uniref:Circadian input-output histidine kinase CikA n=1 Tax=Coleofasciculus chthonoplastes PCC 7420 TaxID=118168 RepID=B4W2Z0_9CYAN|nr:response regulator [Coleofasciculus chthonoplastes]EDX71511.1 ATPase, histidine kinase-, DNA gyrase B-, and HSP90-like domain protein [Coleofasciculus chthonoplastes PCC 7420]